MTDDCTESEFSFHECETHKFCEECRCIIWNGCCLKCGSYKTSLKYDGDDAEFIREFTRRAVINDFTIFKDVAYISGIEEELITSNNDVILKVAAYNGSLEFVHKICDLVRYTYVRLRYLNLMEGRPALYHSVFHAALGGGHLNVFNWLAMRFDLRDDEIRKNGFDEMIRKLNPHPFGRLTKRAQ